MFKLFRNKFFWLLLLVAIASLVLMFSTTAHRDNLTFAEKVIRDAYMPMQRGISGFRNNWGGWTVVFSEKTHLQQRIKELEAENGRLSIENQSLRESEQEIVRLRLLLNFEDSNRENYDLLAAHLVARSPNNWYKSVTIDRGSRQGVEKGMPIINPSGLVGLVASVSENSAQVSLMTDREMAVGATILETRETNGIVEGLGNSNQLRMINIPYYSEVKKDDNIISSGLSAVYPPGINIGTVTEVSREPNGLLLVAMIKPAVEFDKLEEVFVVTGYRPVIESEVEEE